MTVPLQNEHFTRRPIRILRELDVTIEATGRRTLGAIEWLQATKR